MFRAVLWDFGGVIVSSPFEAFDGYERANGLPEGFLRAVNAANPDTNAWARLERDEIAADEFDAAFATESGWLGHQVRGRDVLDLLTGTVRREMVVALDAVIDAGYRTACLTNNVLADRREPGAGPDEIGEVMARFDVVVESSKVRVRKPEPRFYAIACELLGVDPPECVFLDDLGVNLKPARAMGMTTIKVADPHEALAELSVLLALDLTGP